MTPCPICGREPKWHHAHNGWILSCVGHRHTVAVTDEGAHQVALYKGKTQEEVAAAWDKAMAGRGAAA